MKKSLLFLSIMFSTFAFAQCVVDSTITDPGIYPVNGSTSNNTVYMPNGGVGVMYNEVVQIKAPTDTVIDTMGFQLPATIDSIKLISVAGLPASLSYVCNTSNCLYNGGENGCATFSGTPTAADAGFHQAKIKVLGWVSITGIGTLSDTIETDLEITIDPMGIEQFVNKQTVSIQPNPFTKNARFQFNALQNKTYTFKMIDLTGRTIQKEMGTTSVGENTILINRNDWPEGIYFYTLEIGGEAITGKVVVAN